jgi:hypothetical protein
MALTRGFNAAAALKTAAGGGGDSRHHFMRDGEMTLCRFFGSFERQETPVYSKKHYVRRLAVGDQHLQCGDNTDSPCVMCYLRAHKDPGISTSDVGNLWMKDYAKYHKMDAPVRALKPSYMARPGILPKPEDYVETQYPTCLATKTRTCEFCKMGNEAKPRGFKYFDLAKSHTDVLMAKQAELREYCRCGAMTEDNPPGPTLAVESYYCSNPECYEAVDYNPAAGKPVVTCKKCRQTLVPCELLSCSNPNCSNPERSDIQDYIFRVRRVGEKKDTRYSFDPVMPCRPPTAEELEQAEKEMPKWEELLAPLPPEVQAQKLGVPNPFPPSAGHGAQAYAAPVRPPAPSRAAPQAVAYEDLPDPDPTNDDMPY